jgi:pimeloyl-ACP methyl ester carboxylesterase
MMQLHASMVNKYTALFVYQDKKVHVSFYTRRGVEATVDTVLFLGTGQVGKIPRWVAANMPAGVAVVEGLPHWESDPSGSDLVAFSHLYTRSAYDAVLKEFGRTSMHIIASSQAAPSATWLANQMPEQVQNVALILPMGFNTAYFGLNDAARFKELLKRALQSMLQKEQSIFSDVRNMYISLTIMKIVFAGIVDGSTVKKYSVGISEDMIEVLRQLSAKQKRLHRKLTIYLGARDKVFPPHEIRQALRDADIRDVSLITVPGISHASLAISKYRPLLARVVDEVRSRCL